MNCKKFLMMALMSLLLFGCKAQTTSSDQVANPSSPPVASVATPAMKPLLLNPNSPAQVAFPTAVYSWIDIPFVIDQATGKPKLEADGKTQIIDTKQIEARNLHAKWTADLTDKIGFPWHVKPDES